MTEPKFKVGQVVRTAQGYTAKIVGMQWCPAVPLCGIQEGWNVLLAQRGWYCEEALQSGGVK